MCVSVVLSESSEAFYYSLQQTQIREAYLLGRSADTAKITALLDPYARHFPFPPAGSRVESVEFRTPYAQVVRRSWEHSNDYDLDQAEKDYASQPSLVVVSVIVCSRLISSESATLPSDRHEPADAWLGFQFLVSQDHSIVPKKMRGRSFSVGRSGKGFRKEVLMDFDTSQFGSGTAKVRVTTPDAQTVDAEFDLDALK
jgi:hypothetical protein